MKLKWREYLKLTKPTINLLVLITGATALVVEGTLVSDWLRFAGVLAGLFLTAGCANALNQYFERDIDKQMTRTMKKRPLANGTLSPRSALAFAIGCGVAGVLGFAAFYTIQAALLGLATILFYSLFYTLYLKPRTHLNIVIGGAAGAMGPVIAWAAVTGQVFHPVPWLLFAIIFFWTPPHFWALAYCLKEDYKTVKYPMLPNAKGDDETMRQIMAYTLVTVAVTLALVLVGAGTIALVLAALLGGYFVWRVIKVQQSRTTRDAWGLFGYSIIYLLVLFVGLMVDAGFNTWN